MMLQKNFNINNNYDILRFNNNSNNIDNQNNLGMGEIERQGKNDNLINNYGGYGIDRFKNNGISSLADEVLKKKENQVQIK